MLSRTFDAAVRGFHYFRKYWSPEKEEKLFCLHEENNAFDYFAIKTCQEDGTIVGHLPRELSRTLKFILDRGARILAVLTSTHYRKSPLVQGGIEIPCKVTVEMSPTLKNGQLLDRLMELVDAVYSEPTAPIILGSIFADELEVECVSDEIYKKNLPNGEKRKKVKETKSHDIRDMFYKNKDSKRSKSEDANDENTKRRDENTETIIID